MSAVLIRVGFGRYRSGSASRLTDTTAELRRPETTSEWLVLDEPGGEYEIVAAGAFGEIILDDDREVSAGFQRDGVAGESPNDVPHVVHREQDLEGVAGRGDEFVFVGRHDDMVSVAVGRDRDCVGSAGEDEVGGDHVAGRDRVREKVGRDGERGGVVERREVREGWQRGRCDAALAKRKVGALVPESAGVVDGEVDGCGPVVAHGHVAGLREIDTGLNAAGPEGVEAIGCEFDANHRDVGRVRACYGQAICVGWSRASSLAAVGISRGVARTSPVSVPETPTARRLWRRWLSRAASREYMDHQGIRRLGPTWPYRGRVSQSRWGLAVGGGVGVGLDGCGVGTRFVKGFRRGVTDHDSAESNGAVIAREKC